MNDEVPRDQLEPATKPVRPRDEYGRPLPRGSESRLDLPDFDAMDLDECHAEAIRFFDAGNYFGAHEAWETCWAKVRGTEDEEFFKGLAQLGAGYTHWMRGNAHGAAALLGRAHARIGLRGSPHRGIDIASFLRHVEDLRATAHECDAHGRPLPPLLFEEVPQAVEGAR
ncbi:MAG: DUF309 domain-containing protein [Dehalococcoidia bacterium]